MFNAGTIRSTLGLDNNPFTQGILSANSITAVFGQNITNFLANPLMGVLGAAKAALRYVKNLTQEIAGLADEGGKLAASLDVDVYWLTALDYAANRSGSSFAQVKTALERTAKTASDAARGTGEGARVFKDLGVSVTDSTGKLRNIKDIFLDSAQALSQYDDKTQRVAMAQRLFGRSATELMPLLNEGKAGINALTKRAQELGVAFDKEGAAGAAEFNDSMLDMQSAWQGIWRQSIVPLLTKLAPVMSNVGKIISKVLGPPLKLIATIFGVIFDVIAPLSDLFSGFASIISTVLAPALWLLTGVLKVVSGIINAIVSAFKWLYNTIGGAFNWVAKKLGFGGDDNSVAAAGGDLSTANAQIAINVDPNLTAAAVVSEVAPAIASGVTSAVETTRQAVAIGSKSINQRIS